MDDYHAFDVIMIAQSRDKLSDEVYDMTYFQACMCNLPFHSHVICNVYVKMKVRMCAHAVKDYAKGNDVK